jgi:hypothetical protein
MPTKHGFVQQIEVGRAGLVRVTLAHPDGSTGLYVIHDLDADPERFNERLSKLAVLRDAMNRAEPVLIEHTSGEQGEEIQAAARISRDDLSAIGRVEIFSGMVLDLLLHSHNRMGVEREHPDVAVVQMLLTTLQPGVFLLDMQAGERLVAVQQLDMIREAQNQGRLLRVFVHGRPDEDALFILGVAIDDPQASGDDAYVTVDGFVESLSLIPLPTATPLPATTLAHVRFTTAPAFDGPGNTVGLVLYTPLLLDLLVPKNSLTYQLIEAGLRDCLRMRVRVALYKGRDEQGEREPVPVGATGAARNADTYEPIAAMTTAPAIAVGEPLALDQLDEGAWGLLFGAELLAPLASASRGVWIKISRQSLDHGPDGERCTDGVPSSDLSPQTLRDLRIPYPAEWRGLGCFNHGIYRLQFKLPVDFSVSVDDAELCLHDAEDDSGARFAHACLDGEHEVVIKLDGWRCDDQFLMDIYRLR